MTTEARQRKRIWKWTAGLAMIVALTLTFVCFTQERSLLEQSTIAANAHDWWIAPYYWLSDHQILFSRLGGHNGLYRYDTRTRQETLLGPASRELTKSDFMISLDSLRVSPDGTRLLWIGADEETMYGAWLDGSHYFTCVPRRDPATWTKVRWTSDSRRWVAFVSDRQGATDAMVYDGDISHKPTIVPTAASDRSAPLELMDLISTQSLVLNNHVLAGEWIDDLTVTPGADIVDVGLGIPAIGLKTRHVDLPPDTAIHEMIFSPQGDRIAWFLTKRYVPPWERFLLRLLPRFPVQSLRVESLWVSDIDGTRMREIGGRNLERSEEFRPQLDQLQWVPGGNRLSYRYRSRLYTVAAK